MKSLKIIILILILIWLSIVVFYFYGKQAQYPISDYTKTQSKNVQYLSTSDTISVFTYNIGYFSGMTNNRAVSRPKSLIETNLSKATQLLNDLNPDFIAFQEIDFSSSRTYHINQYQQLFKNLDVESGAMAVNWDKKYVPFPYWPIKYQFGEMFSGQAVLSKFEILSNDRTVLPQPDSNPFYYNDFYLDRLVQIVWFQFNDKKLLLLNVHFEAWDGPTREQQAAIVLSIYRKYAKDYPVILMGDFNCTPPFSTNAFDESTINQFLDEKGLEMATNMKNFKENQSDYYTFSSESPFQKIDYIFYNTKYFECIDSRVIHQAADISDHLPIFARLKYKSGK